MSTPPACITTNPFLFVYEIMITHHQPQSLSSTIPLCTAYKLILYHPLNPWYFVHEPILHCLQAHPVSSTEPTLFRPRTHPAPSTSSSCIIRCPMVFRLLTHPALSPNPPYIASTPTFTTRSPKAFFFTTQKKKKQKTTVFYFFFFNLYFSFYTLYA